MNSASPAYPAAFSKRDEADRDFGEQFAAHGLAADTALQLAKGEHLVIAPGENFAIENRAIRQLRDRLD